MNYSQLVGKGVLLVERYKETKYEICELALQVCEIRLGGHANRGKQLYSISKFSVDIGMKVHTLRKWLEEHRNVTRKLINSKKIIGKPSKDDYTAIKKVFEYNNINRHSSDKQVANIYDKVTKMTETDRQLIECIKRAKQIRNFTQDSAVNLLDQEDVALLKELLLISLSNIDTDISVDVAG